VLLLSRNHCRAVSTRVSVTGITWFCDRQWSGRQFKKLGYNVGPFSIELKREYTNDKRFLLQSHTVACPNL
jgi:hypothetical protein